MNASALPHCPIAKLKAKDTKGCPAGRASARALFEGDFSLFDGQSGGSRTTIGCALAGTPA